MSSSIAAKVSPNVANAIRGLGACCAARWKVRSKYGVKKKPAHSVGNANASGSDSIIGVIGVRSPTGVRSTPPGSRTTNAESSVTAVPAVRQNALPRSASSRPMTMNAIGVPVAAMVLSAPGASVSEERFGPTKKYCAAHPAK